MPKDDAATVEVETPDEPKKKKGKKKFVLALVVVVALGGAYKVLGTKKAPAKASAEPTPKVFGPVINLDSITLNLADGHYLKIGVALQLSKYAKSGDFTNTDAKTLDATISVFGAETVPQLSAPGGRDAAKETLAKKVEALYPGQVIGIYFTDFVMQ